MRLSFFLCLFFYTLLAHSSTQLQSSDIDYYIHKNSSFSFIFSKNFLKKKNNVYIYEKLIYYDDIYKQSFLKPLSEKPIYIFASPRNQTSNASTSGTPFLRALFFPSGVDQITRLATTSWEDTVISHEMAHIFQLGQVSDYLAYLKAIFRNSEVIFIPIPIFLNVNLTMPLFLLEGHAVLNESILAPGGRLYSGSTRALVFSQIKHEFKSTKQFTEDYLLNITEDTFSIEQQYAHGGYFFNYLLQNYKLTTINNIFKKYVEHFILPFSFIAIKDTFQTVFNDSFENLVHSYIQHYLPMAAQQKKSPEKVLFKSHVCPPLNRDNHEIYFLTTDLKRTPVLRTLDLNTGKWTSQKKTLAIGKIFKIQDEYYVSTSSKISPTERVYGLFSEGMHLVNYKSQILQDIYKNDILSVDTSNNMRGFHLLMNGRFYTKINSNALFDAKGDIYYFKQKGEYRVMYKNRSPIFEFKGFYGKPVDVDPYGTVYFIAASQLGSSLFAWNPLEKNYIYRVSSSDTIIEAIKAYGNKFLICEVTPHFYTYKVISLTDIISVRPSFYNYPFESNFQTVSNTSDPLDIDTDIDIDIASDTDIDIDIDSGTDIEDKYSNSEDTDKKDADYMQELHNIDTIDHSAITHTHKIHSAKDHFNYSSYSGFRHIRFNGIELGWLNDPITGYNGLVHIALRDPLEYNSFRFTYQQSLTDNWFISTKYTNQMYRLFWHIQHNYLQGLDNFFGSRAYMYIHEFSKKLQYPILEIGYWSSAISTNSAITYARPKSQPKASYYLSVEPALQIQYRRAYRKNFHFHRHFLLTTGIKYQMSLSNNNSNYHWKNRAHFVFHWGGEFYTTPFFNYQLALKEQSIPFRYFKSLGVFENANFNFFITERALEQTNDFSSAGVRLQKIFETPLYFSRYPLSLRTITPTLTGTYIQFIRNNEANKNSLINFFEWSAGLNIGILFHHKIKANLALSLGYSHPVDNWLEGIITPTNKTQTTKQKNGAKLKITNPISYQEELIKSMKDNTYFNIHLKTYL